METEKRVGARSRVWRSRWFAGFVIGTLIVGAVALGGFALGGGSPPSGAVGSGSELYITLRIPGITDFGHKNEIEVESFHWGVSQADGRIVVQEFVVAKWIDKASPKLYEALAKGEHIKEATIAVYEGRGGGVAMDFKEYVVYAMEDVLVVSIKTGAISPRVEDVSFRYQKISIDYTAQGGPVETLLCGTGTDWYGCERK